MPPGHGHTSVSARGISVGRKGVASLLFALARPTDAKASALDGGDLPESGIYIEHFAFTESWDTPPFIDRESYTASRDWKLDLHARHGTTLIETFSHEQRAGRLMANLARRLREHGVAFRPIPTEDVFAVLNEQGRVAPFTRLVGTFLQHFKGSRLSVEKVLRRAAESEDADRAEAFLAGFRPILERYEGRLSRSGEIDFDDMVNRATDHVAAGRYESPYRLHTDRRVPGHLRRPGGATEGAAGSARGRAAVRGRRRLAGRLPFRRSGHRHHARFRDGLPGRDACGAGDDLPLFGRGERCGDPFCARQSRADS